MLPASWYIVDLCTLSPFASPMPSVFPFPQPLSGSWRIVDLSQNQLGSGAGLMAAHLIEGVAELSNSKGGGSMASPRVAPRAGRLQRSHTTVARKRFGDQLAATDGNVPMTLVLNENPVGGMGLRCGADILGTRILTHLRSVYA